ncbi:hypothetical protein JOH50_003886 [Rhizobium leguminosarum]|nr:hypothetical protein [Rhizobium leguminosarum]
MDRSSFTSDAMATMDMTNTGGVFAVFKAK